MDRRSFLANCAKVLAASAFLRAGPLRAAEPVLKTDASDIQPDLAVARGDAKDATLRALAAIGGMERFVRPGQVVAVKPNASFPKPAAVGATTHPDVLAAVIEACFAADARRVLVIDHTMAGAKRCFKINGTAETVAAFPKAKLVSLDQEKHYRPIDVPMGKALHKTTIPVSLQKADVFINVPTAKSHSATAVSLGLKNLMGLVWDRRCFHLEFDLDQGIADLATVLVPDLTVLDSTIIMKTGGPTGPGEVDHFGGVIAGTDPVAVDAYGVTLASWNGQQYDPDQIAYLRYAAEHGVGTLDLASLRIAELS